MLNYNAINNSSGAGMTASRIDAVIALLLAGFFVNIALQEAHKLAELGE